MITSGCLQKEELANHWSSSCLQCQGRSSCAWFLLREASLQDMKDRALGMVVISTNAYGFFWVWPRVCILASQGTSKHLWAFWSILRRHSAPLMGRSGSHKQQQSMNEYYNAMFSIISTPNVGGKMIRQLFCCDGATECHVTNLY